MIILETIDEDTYSQILKGYKIIHSYIMLNLFLSIILATYLWSIAVISSRGPISKLLKLNLRFSFKYFRLFVASIFKLINLLFLEVIFSLFQNKQKNATETSSSISKDDSFEANIKESDYPTEIMMISSKLKQD